MKFEQTDDIYLILNIRDSRGKKIRVNSLNELKVRVWTQDPSNYLSFGISDIAQHKEYDAIAIPDFMMESLPSGVIVYEYKYNTYSKDFARFDGKYDRSDVVTTDIYWKNKNMCGIPAINYKSFERLQDLIEKERKERIQTDKELNGYIETSNNALSDEVDRATEAENILNEKVELTNEKVDTVETKLNEEIDRSNQVDIEIFKYIKDVEETQNEINNRFENYYTKEEVDGFIEDVEESQKEVTDSLKNYYTKEEVNGLIDEVDVKDQLGNYVEKTELETTLNGYKTEIDNTFAKKSELPSIEGLATESWVNTQIEPFCKIWVGSEDDYNSLPDKDNNTIYVIQ